jgi:ribosome biogenesis GTPase
VLLTKCDLHPDPSALVREAEASAPGAPVVATSGRTGSGLEALSRHLAPARTAVLVGSSGVGKSTLVNRLLGAEVQAVKEIRASDERGVHTTTARRLLPLPSGALLVDTPGMRELSLLDDDGLDAAFADVQALAASCRFSDCSHEVEPGCAVRAAAESGELPFERLDGYFRLRREMAYLTRRDDARTRELERRRGRTISRAVDLQRRLRGE